jgi:hypothetical protein
MQIRDVFSYRMNEALDTKDVYVWGYVKVQLTASVVWWSEFLAEDPEVPDSIPALPEFFSSRWG